MTGNPQVFSSLVPSRSLMFSGADTAARLRSFSSDGTLLPLKVDIADSGHKVTTSLAMEIISEPFDLLGFYTNEGKILCFKPGPVTGTLGLGPEVMTDGEGLSPQLPLYPLREQAKDVEAKYRRLFLTLA